ncbi:uncharacterized protein LOC111317724 [Durio zibethinus]|uniref:Uncharacterized protein LOC111317724 n=1 Tax=Durio zibethinus TaxID=66656 RepID=A0A6P6BFM6_DURZI|nr:uncharacterized protein LOC111317724 [Durio zibethinus]
MSFSDDGFKSVSTLKTWREVPPSHYILKIESFSSLLRILDKTKVDNHESNEFKASGYTWRLLLYPSGDQERNGSNHISLYLKIMYPPPEMNALLIFFIYDQLKDKYLSIQDVEVRQFNKTNRVWGLSQLVSLDCFRNTSNGFLVNDSCVFGVEVFDIKCDAFEVQGAYLRTLRQQSEIVKIWTVEKLSELKETGHFSEQFSVGGYNWKFHLYPKGAPKAKGKCLSIYLCLQDQDKFPPGWKMHVEFKLSINDQVHENNSDRITKIGNAWFSALDTAWGFPCFIKLADLRRSTSNIFRDAMEIELQIISMSTTIAIISGHLVLRDLGRVSATAITSVVGAATIAITSVVAAATIAITSVAAAATTTVVDPASAAVSIVTAAAIVIATAIAIVAAAAATAHVVTACEKCILEKLTVTMRNVAPAHYTLEIESLPFLKEILSKTGLHSYESPEFQASGYKWRLILYPEGDKQRGGEGHISLYLEIVGIQNLGRPWEIDALLNFFVFDASWAQYKSFQDGRVKRFNAVNKERGFSRLLTLAEFYDTSNGYLSHGDRCKFGVEVFVIKSEGKGERFFTMDNLSKNVYVEKFYELHKGGRYSKEFTIGDYKWKLHLYPKGVPKVNGEFLSIFIHLVDNEKIPIGNKMYVEFKLRMNHQVEKTGGAWFRSFAPAWGFPCFTRLADPKPTNTKLADPKQADGIKFADKRLTMGISDNDDMLFEVLFEAVITSMSMAIDLYPDPPKTKANPTDSDAPPGFP